MGKKLDLINQRFGRLQVFSECARRKDKSVVWLCLCECGSLTEVSTNHLRMSRVLSCGCLAADNSRKVITKHGMSDTPVHKVWKNMKQRCYNTKCDKYEDYGGRGISVCDEWLNDSAAFIIWALDSGYSEELQINRVENNGNYEPNNCNFITRSENCNNKRPYKNNSSGYRRVALDSKKESYEALVTYRGRRHYLGRYRTSREAAVVGDKFIIKNEWPHILNFPELKNEK